MRTISRNRHAEVTEIREKATHCQVFTLDNSFTGTDIDPMHAWNALATYEGARLQERSPGREWWITVHDNRWYELHTEED